MNTWDPTAANPWLNTGFNLDAPKQCNHLRPSEVRAIRAKWATGNYTVQQLADEYERAKSAIWKLVHNHTYQDIK